jgi:hypothetical protein
MNNRLMRLSPIFAERVLVPAPELAFVLMPFSQLWSERVWRTIESAIRQGGLQPERADNRHNLIIMEDVWSGIVDSRGSRTHWIKS